MSEISNENIVESLYKIMCSGTSTMADSRVENNDYFKRRVMGFKAEVAFEDLVKQYPSVTFLEGGQFISKRLSGVSEDRNLFLYTTVSSDDPDLYKEVYETVSSWAEVGDLFFIKIKNNDWGEEAFKTRVERGSEIKDDEILKPKYTFFLYDKKSRTFKKHPIQDFGCILNHFNGHTRTPNLYHLRKREQFEYFKNYDIDVLKKIYGNRYFLDVILRQAQGRQIIDLDGFLKTNVKLIMVEIKEKSPIKNDEGDQETWQYGWDSRRILWYLYLFKKVGLNILYNVRQIRNRNDREFVQWDSISIDDFLKGTSWSSSRGGGGGEDTLLAPYTFFTRLENMLESISK